MAIGRNIVISRRLQQEAGRPLAHHGSAIVTTCAEGTGRGHRGTCSSERQREVAETPIGEGGQMIRGYGALLAVVGYSLAASLVGAQPPLAVSR
jgi:hypothetical protein